MSRLADPRQRGDYLEYGSKKSALSQPGRIPVQGSEKETWIT